MYRDDTCPVCGTSLPPDHLYCREHAASVDARLHEIGSLLARLQVDLERAAELLPQVAGETWDYLAADDPDDPIWPPRPICVMTADGADVEVDVDAEPGMVTVSVTLDLPDALAALASALRAAEVTSMARAAAAADDAGATH